MTISNKTVYRSITILVSAMLLTSVITTGFQSLVSGMLLGALIMSLFNDDLASYEYKSKKDCKCYDCQIKKARKLVKTADVSDEHIACHFKIKNEGVPCKYRRVNKHGRTNKS